MSEENRLEGYLAQHVSEWLAIHSLAAIEIDCATAVMLKIIDGKCKMPADEKVIMTELYNQVKDQAGHLLTSDMHELIAEVGPRPDEEKRMRVYEYRVLAETKIARPTMKAFKARIRQAGLLDLVTVSN